MPGIEYTVSITTDPDRRRLTTIPVTVTTGMSTFRKACFQTTTRPGSPLVRAVQTAEILSRALKQDEVGVLEELGPGIPVSKVFAAVARRVKDGEGVALIGHDPQMSLLVVALAQLDPADAARVDFSKGAIVRIDVDALPPGKSQPRWNLKPRSRAILEGLPLAKATADRPPRARR